MHMTSSDDVKKRQEEESKEKKKKKKALRLIFLVAVFLKMTKKLFPKLSICNSNL